MSDGHVPAHAGTVCVLGSADEAGEAALARVVDQYAQSTGGYRAQVNVADTQCFLLPSAWHLNEHCKARLHELLECIFSTWKSSCHFNNACATARCSTFLQVTPEDLQAGMIEWLHDAMHSVSSLVSAVHSRLCSLSVCDCDKPCVGDIRGVVMGAGFLGFVPRCGQVWRTEAAAQISSHGKTHCCLIWIGTASCL